MIVMKSLSLVLLILPTTVHALSGSIEIPGPAEPVIGHDGCWNFAASLPMAGVRFHPPGTLIAGPLRPFGLGLGASYTLSCATLPSLAVSMYLFSEGLDFENKYQLALGATIGVRLMSSVTLGIGLHYDLVRAVRGGNGALKTAGLLAGAEADHRSITWVLMAHWLIF